MAPYNSIKYVREINKQTKKTQKAQNTITEKIYC